MSANINPPKRWQWVCIELYDKSSRICRFIRTGVARDTGKRWWYLDQGIGHGAMRDDLWIPVELIVSAVSPVPKPPLLLTFRDPNGVKQRVGRYANMEQAERAIDPMRSFASDIRIETRR